MKPSNLAGAHILATGSAVPDICISNETLSSIVNTSDEWISNRTGIKTRRILPANQSIIDIATRASCQALNKADLNPEELDLIILATSTPNDLFGSASQLQASIKATNAAAFDITAACSGFVISLITASQFLNSGSYKNILVVGADILSRWVDWSDRSSCILFGDGAGAAILQSNINNDILGFQINTNGLDANQLSIASKASEEIVCNPAKLKFMHSHYDYLRMNGKEVYKFAVSRVPESIRQCLKDVNLLSNDISWLILHQANQRILNAVADKLDIPKNKIISNIQSYGNTSAASIPIALHEAFDAGKIMNGDIIAIAGFGAGLTWATVIIKWH
uniref:Beta-ketoacyl-[acyl-carrier-protein] synthase III n=1 Tax=Acrochaetium secundatum TaxID=209631 RepID=A0A4D6BKN7_9FLOR|nr:beta-ketoacyl-acyl carrier protein synthase III [Acrochaetium secundatum]QBX88345.1 beta-ketoacyl-acyl carrier protein synthase III [Acrochaetium secundatum]